MIPHRPFGNTGLSLPALAMGAGFPIGFAGLDRSVQTVRHAFDQGIRYFDTSPLYRFGASQAILGEALVDAPQNDYFLATKIGHFKEAHFFRSPEAMLVQFRENLRLLRRNSVDLLQIHEADWDNWWTDRPDLAPCELFDLQKSYHFANAPVIHFLRDIKARGLARFIGITGNNARHLGRLITELTGIDSVLVAYNYHPLNTSARDFVIPPARAKNMAILIAGIFTFIHRIPAGWRTEGTYFGPRADQQLAQLQKLQHSTRDETGTPIPLPELALRFVAPDPAISTLLCGACHPQEIDQNLAVLQKGPLPPALHAALESIAAQF